MVSPQITQSSSGISKKRKRGRNWDIDAVRKAAAKVKLDIDDLKVIKQGTVRSIFGQLEDEHRVGGVEKLQKMLKNHRERQNKAKQQAKGNKVQSSIGDFFPKSGEEGGTVVLEDGGADDHRGI